MIQTFAEDKLLIGNNTLKYSNGNLLCEISISLSVNKQVYKTKTLHRVRSYFTGEFECYDIFTVSEILYRKSQNVGVLDDINNFYSTEVNYAFEDWLMNGLSDLKLINRVDDLHSRMKQTLKIKGFNNRADFRVQIHDQCEPLTLEQFTTIFLARTHSKDSQVYWMEQAAIGTINNSIKFI